MPIVKLRDATVEDYDILRDMVAHYWNELMPHALVIRDPIRRAAYFDEEFVKAAVARSVWWALCDDERIGFVRIERWVSHDGSGGTIRDFYIEPTSRRQGMGAVVAQLIVERLVEDGCHRVDLNVRYDNPAALAFWQAQDFTVQLYQLRRYLDAQ